MGSEALDQLLDDDLAEHDPVMLGHLSNHLPMALIALHAMGADDTCLREYANNYRSKLDQRRPLGQSIGLDDTLPSDPAFGTPICSTASTGRSQPLESNQYSTDTSVRYWRDWVAQPSTASSGSATPSSTVEAPTSPLAWLYWPTATYR